MATPTDYKVYTDTKTKLKLYNARVRRAEEDISERKPFQVEAWSRYRGEFVNAELVPDGHYVAVPDGTGIIDAMFSALTAVDVEASVLPGPTGTQDQARVVQQALNEEWSRIRGQGEVKRAVKDALLVDSGFVKVGYEYEEDQQEVDRDPEEIAQDVRGLMKAAEAAGIGAPSPDQIAEVVPGTEKQTIVLKDRIVIDWVPQDSILLDPDVERWEDMRWVGTKTALPVEEVRENKAYREFCKRQGDLKKLEALKADSDLNLVGKYKSEETGRVCVYELYDFHTGQVCTWTKDSTFLLDERPNPFSVFPDFRDRNPFVAYTPRVDNKNIRGLGEMRVSKSSLDELTLYRSRLATYLDRAVPKLLAKRGVFTEPGRNALASTDYLAVVEMEEGSDMQSDVKTLDPPAMPSEVFGVPDRIKEGLFEATGANELTRGLFPDRRRTATETVAVENNSNVRQAEKQNGLEDFYHTIFRRVVALMQMFYDSDRIATLVEHEGPVQWKWSNQDIVFGTYIDIELTPKKVETYDARQERAVQWFNLLAPLGVQGGPVNLQSLGLWALKESGFRMEEIQSVFYTQEQQQQQAQQAAQQAGQAAAAQSAGSAAGQAAVAGTEPGTETAGGVPTQVASALSDFSRPTTQADVANEQTIVSEQA
jgi:hypothetical protein